jgi:hypothetical protein
MTTNVLPPFYEGNVWQVLESVSDELPQDVEHLTLQITKSEVSGWYHVSISLSVRREKAVRNDD